MASEVAERNRSLWALAAAPGIWAAHLLLSYGTAAVYCAKLSAAERLASGSLGPVRVAIAAYTAVSLVAIGIIGWRGFARHRLGGATVPHDSDSPEDRHRFLGFATLLLAGLSAVAVVFAGLTAVFIGSCR